MTGVHAVVAVKGFERGKYRLAGALNPSQRHLLIATMLDDVLNALRATRGIASISVLTGDSAVLPPGMRHICDPGMGLNVGVACAATVLSDLGARSMLILPADLPFVTSDDIGALLAGGRDHDAVIAPDARRAGTNALLLTPPDLIATEFGEQSFDAHVQAIRREPTFARLAQALQMATEARGNAPARGGELQKRAFPTRLQIIERPGLAHDIDVMEDLLALSSKLSPRYRFLDAALRKVS